MYTLKVIYLTCLTIWALYFIYHYYEWNHNISRKRFIKNFINCLSQQYINEKKIKKYYAYSNNTKRNFLFDYITEKANIYFAKDLDKSLYIKYTKFLPELFVCSYMIFFIIGISFIPGSFKEAHLVITILVIFIFSIPACLVFYSLNKFGKEVTYRNDPEYMEKRESDLSFRWEHHVAKKFNLPGNQIIKDAEELSTIYYNGHL